MAYDKIEAQLMAVKDFNKIVVNAVDYADLKVFCVALYRAMAKGKVFMFRTAAAIVKVMGGVSDQPLLTRAQMVVKETDNGGIIVVGSHTNKTTAQVEELKKLTDIEFMSSTPPWSRGSFLRMKSGAAWQRKRSASAPARPSAATRPEL